mmetsp:Transcript_17608/g.36481  ORF Transcript_17608/g.36481 Transcript_17608/m.36481 type:complete len:223 (-) Transcript_17608:7968-8636(-)
MLMAMESPMPTIPAMRLAQSSLMRSTVVRSTSARDASWFDAGGNSNTSRGSWYTALASPIVLFPTLTFPARDSKALSMLSSFSPTQAGVPPPPPEPMPPTPALPSFAPPFNPETALASETLPLPNLAAAIIFFPASKNFFLAALFPSFPPAPPTTTPATDMALLATFSTSSISFSFFPSSSFFFFSNASLFFSLLALSLSLSFFFFSSFACSSASIWALCSS